MKKLFPKWFYLHLPISPVDETPWVPLTVLDQSFEHIPPSTWRCFNTLAQKKPLRMARYAEWTLKRVACKNGTIGYNWCNLVWSTIILLAVLPLYPNCKLIYFKRRSKMEVSRAKPLFTNFAWLREKSMVTSIHRKVRDRSISNLEIRKSIHRGYLPLAKKC